MAGFPAMEGGVPATVACRHKRTGASFEAPVAAVECEWDSAVKAGAYSVLESRLPVSGAGLRRP